MDVQLLMGHLSILIVLILTVVFILIFIIVIVLKFRGVTKLYFNTYSCGALLPYLIYELNPSLDKMSEAVIKVATPGFVKRACLCSE